MLSKYFKHAGLAALLLGCSLGLAQAQQNTKIPPPVPGQAAVAAPAGAHAGATAGATKAIATGWNFEECNATQTYFDGTNWWVYTYNNDGSSYWYSVNVGGLWTVQNMLKSACEHGSYWVYCPNSTCSGWTQVWIYTHLD